MKYDFDRMTDRRGTLSEKWENPRLLEEAGAHPLLPLWVADMDFPVAEPIRQALLRRCEHDVFGYAFTGEDYRAAVQSWYARRHQLHFAAEQACFAPGVVAGLAYLLHLLTQPGDGVLIQPPVYYPFARKIREAGCQVLENRLLHLGGGEYRMNLDDLERQAQRAKVMILCSPHNPVGRVWTEAELRQVERICAANDVYLLVDEIHGDLLRRGVRQYSPAALCPENKHIVTCLSASKSFNLAGMSCSTLLIPDDELRRRYQDYLRQVVSLSGPSLFAQVAFTAAYNEGEEWLEQLCAYLDDNFRLIGEQLTQQLPQAVYRVPEGTYLAGINVAAYAPDTAALARRLAAEHGLILEEGELFGAEGQGWLRLNAACPRALLRQALELLCRQLLPTANRAGENNR